MTEAPEPEDKLDATAKVAVNGPEDDMLGWRQVDWRQVEVSVRRLRQRIFTASQAGDLKKVRSLQKLMLRSRANTLLSVRRVTDDGRNRTALTTSRRAPCASRYQMLHGQAAERMPYRTHVYETALRAIWHAFPAPE
jgi:hypothetical protein